MKPEAKNKISKILLVVQMIVALVVFCSGIALAIGQIFRIMIVVVIGSLLLLAVSIAVYKMRTDNSGTRVMVFSIVVSAILVAMAQYTLFGTKYFYNLDYPLLGALWWGNSFLEGLVALLVGYCSSIILLNRKSKDNSSQTEHIINEEYCACGNKLYQGALFCEKCGKAVGKK